MRKFFLPFLLFFIIPVVSAYGSSSVPLPPNGSQGCPEASEGVEISPCVVDEDRAEVKLSFKKVPIRDGESSSVYYYCLKTNPKDCDDDDLKKRPTTTDTSKGITTTGSLNNTERISFESLCGDGESKLKTKPSCHSDGSDWFHQGKIYQVTLFDKPKASSNIIAEASFYITHKYPEVKEPQPGERPELNIKTLKTGNGSIEVTLARSVADNKKDRKYWLSLQGRDNDYNGPAVCITVPPDGSGTGKVLIPNEIKSDGTVVQVLTEGNYVITIANTRDGCKPGEFTYWQIPVLIATGLDANNKPNPGRIGEGVEDPFGQENSKNLVRRTPPPICDENQQDANGYCTSVRTGLGISIHTEPAIFIRDIFRIVLSVGGVAAILFFIRAGYTIMTSAGNKEKVGQAREQITAAVTGLIFIILSLTILEFIGIDILQIPGFTR